jgi:hypothetical protein
MRIQYKLDPFTRLIHVSYEVPETIPPTIQVITEVREKNRTELGTSPCSEAQVRNLCPSNIQARHLNFDVTPYVKEVKGTGIKLCPVVDALAWGLSRPGEFLQRVRILYRAGTDGIYIYQCDAAVQGDESSREMIRICGSTDALERFFNTESLETPLRSKDIYLKPPTEGSTYNRWERVRIWVDGLQSPELQVWLDGKLTNTFDKPPYWVGTEEYDSDTLLAGRHTLKIRARDGKELLEKTFEITGE